MFSFLDEEKQVSPRNQAHLEPVYEIGFRHDKRLPRKQAKFAGPRKQNVVQLRIFQHSQQYKFSRGSKI
jgi:hypothetical protein